MVQGVLKYGKYYEKWAKDWDIWIQLLGYKSHSSVSVGFDCQPAIRLFDHNMY